MSMYPIFGHPLHHSRCQCYACHLEAAFDRTISAIERIVARLLETEQ